MPKELVEPYKESSAASKKTLERGTLLAALALVAACKQ
jgi:hypothetical protein